MTRSTAQTKSAARVLSLLARAGTCCGLTLTADLRIESAWGACRGLLGAGVRSLRGRSVHEVVSGLDTAGPEAVRALEPVVAGGPLLGAVSRARRGYELLLFRAREGSSSLPSRLAGVTAHDLRNPLASIKLNTQALAREAADERAARRFALTLREIAQMERWLEVLVECARPAPPPQLCRAEAVAESVRRACAEELASGGSLRLRIAPGLPPFRGDERRIPLALACLVRAAARAVPLAQVTLAACRRADELRWSVTAPGLFPPRSRGLAFELAERVGADCSGGFEIAVGGGETAFVLKLPARC